MAGCREGWRLDAAGCERSPPPCAEGSGVGFVRENPTARAYSPSHAPSRAPASAACARENQDIRLSTTQIGHGVARVHRGRADMRQQHRVGQRRAAPAAHAARRRRRRARRRAMVPSASAATSASSSTVLPRPILMNTPSGPSADKTAALTAFSRRGPAGRHRDQRVDRLGQSLQRRMVLVGQPFDRAAVVIGDRQAERLQPPGDGQADAAHAEDADAAAAQGQRAAADSCRRAPSGRRADRLRRASSSRTVLISRPIAVSATSSVSTSGVLVTMTPLRRRHGGHRPRHSRRRSWR